MSSSIRRGYSATIPRFPALFFLALLLGASGLMVTYAYFVRTSTGQYIDQSALDEAPMAQTLLGKQAAQLLDTLPVTSLILGGAVVLVMAVVTKRWFAAVVVGATAVAANITTQLLKSSLPNRPFRGVATLDLNSWPSGHSTLAASAAAAVFLMSTPRWRPFVAWLGSCYAVVSGVATLINQWHRPSDVIAAYLVVAFWTVIGGWVMLRWSSSDVLWEGYGSFWTSSILWPLLLTLVGAAAAATTFVLFALFPVASAQGEMYYFGAGVAFIVMSGSFLSVAGIALFGFQVPRASRRPWAQQAYMRHG